MNRREFLLRSGSSGLGLVGASALVAIGGATLIGCSSSNSGGSDDNDEAADDEVEFFVDAASGHVHAFRIPQDTLDNPPAAGFTANTTSDGGHSHSISLNQGELEDIADSINVPGNTSLDSGHTHGYSFA